MPVKRILFLSSLLVALISMGCKKHDAAKLPEITPPLEKKWVVNYCGWKRHTLLC